MFFGPVRQEVLGHEDDEDERIFLGEVGCWENHLETRHPDVRRCREARMRRKLVNTSRNGAMVTNIHDIGVYFGVNVWNSLPDDVCFDSFYRFKCSIMRINLSSHLRYCVMLSLFLFSFIYIMRVVNIVKVN